MFSFFCIRPIRSSFMILCCPPIQAGYWIQDAKPSKAFVPCGHACVCIACWNGLVQSGSGRSSACPNCRREVQFSFPVFIWPDVSTQLRICTGGKSKPMRAFPFFSECHEVQHMAGCTERRHISWDIRCSSKHTWCMLWALRYFVWHSFKAKLRSVQGRGSPDLFFGFLCTIYKSQAYCVYNLRVPNNLKPSDFRIADLDLHPCQLTWDMTLFLGGLPTGWVKAWDVRRFDDGGTTAARQVEQKWADVTWCYLQSSLSFNPSRMTNPTVMTGHQASSFEMFHLCAMTTWAADSEGCFKSFRLFQCLVPDTPEPDTRCGNSDSKAGNHEGPGPAMDDNRLMITGHDWTTTDNVQSSIICTAFMEFFTLFVSVFTCSDLLLSQSRDDYMICMVRGSRARLEHFDCCIFGQLLGFPYVSLFRFEEHRAVRSISPKQGEGPTPRWNSQQVGKMGKVWLLSNI